MQLFIINSLFLKRFLFTLVLAVLLPACQNQQQETFPSGPIRVKIPRYTGNQISLEAVTLHSVDNVSKLSGWAAQFFLSPGDNKGEMFGPSPYIHTIQNSQGEYIATDTFSLELLSLYSNLEMLAFFDREVGTEGLLKRPIKVGVRASVVDPSKKQFEKDQAMYSPRHEALIFVPSQRSQLPLGTNSGVIAHEYFHALFSKIMPRSSWRGNVSLNEKQCKKINDSTEKEIYRIHLLRALNEGLADVWGYLFSGDLDFVSRSLPSESLRDFSKKPEPLLSKEEYKRKIIFNECHSPISGNNYYIYQLGTQIAHPIVHYTRDQVVSKNLSWQQARVKTASALILALKKYSKAIASENDEPSPQDIHDFFSKEVDGFQNLH